MHYFMAIFLSLLCISLYGKVESTAYSPAKSYLSDASDNDNCCDDDDDDTGEVDEDIIIMDEEDNDDEGVNN